MTRPVRSNQWRWLLLALGLASLSGLTWAAFHWSTLRANYTLRQLRHATTEDDRRAIATHLLSQGDIGWQTADRLLQTDNVASKSVLEVLLQQLDASGEPALAGRILQASSGWSVAQQAQLLPAVPLLLKSPLPEAASRCREIVRVGLASADAEQQLQAIRLALRPEVQLSPEIVPLLKSAHEAVRRIAMLAVGPVSDDQPALIGTEELFPWLHDPDAEVRKLCLSALATRGLEPEEINFAQLLSAPRATDRLKLLTELQFGDSNHNVGQWLERLSHDPEPAVRIGAARVAAELRLGYTNWLHRLVDQDSDPTVRRWAGYYRQQTQVLQTRGER